MLFPVVLPMTSSMDAESQEAPVAPDWLLVERVQNEPTLSACSRPCDLAVAAQGIKKAHVYRAGRQPATCFTFNSVTDCFPYVLTLLEVARWCSMGTWGCAHVPSTATVGRRRQKRLHSDLPAFQLHGGGKGYCCSRCTRGTNSRNLGRILNGFCRIKTVILKHILTMLLTSPMQRSNPQWLNWKYNIFRNDFVLFNQRYF